MEKKIMKIKSPGRRDAFFLYKRFMQEVWGKEIKVDYKVTEQPGGEFDPEGVYMHEPTDIGSAQYEVPVKCVAATIITNSHDDEIKITVDIDRMTVDLANFTDADLLRIYDRAHKYRLELDKRLLTKIEELVNASAKGKPEK